jgi:hypothetical protein
VNIIGINGYKRSGKGECALAVEDLRPNVKSVGFADKLKILAAKTLGFNNLSDEECIALMDEAKEEWVIDITDRATGEEQSHVTGRQYLQNIGNEARGVFGENFWIDQVLPPGGDLPGRNAYGKTHYPGVETLCVTDVRYPNEAERICALGGVVWEVVRPGVESDGHASEKPLPRYLVNYQIRNVGDIPYLRTQVALALQETL